MKIKKYAAFIFIFIIGVAFGYYFGIKHALDLAIALAMGFLFAAYLRKKWKKEDNILSVVVFIGGMLSGYGLSKVIGLSFLHLGNI